MSNKYLEKIAANKITKVLKAAGGSEFSSAADNVRRYGYDLTHHVDPLAQLPSKTKGSARVINYSSENRANIKGQIQKTLGKGSSSMDAVDRGFKRIDLEANLRSLRGSSGVDTSGWPHPSHPYKKK